MGTYKKTMENGGQYILRCDNDKETGRDVSFVIIDDVLYNIIGIAEYYEKIAVPKGVRIIKSDSIIDMSDDIDPQGMECGEFRIPASVELIEPNAFSPSYFEIHSITLDSKNKAYKLINGLLYTADGKKLIHFPSDAEEESSVARIPEGTAEIEKGAIQWVKKLIIPDSVTKFGDLSKSAAEWEGIFCAVVGPGSAAEKYCRKHEIPFEYSQN